MSQSSLTHTVRLPSQKISLRDSLPAGSKSLALLSSGNEAISHEDSYAWVLPVKRFSSHDDAERLLERLQEAGFDSYIQASRSSNESVSFMVLVGPKLSRSKFKAIQKELMRQFHLHASSIEPYSDNA